MEKRKRGRPKATKPRVRLSVRVKPETREKLSADGINLGRLIDDIIAKRK